MKRSPMRRKPFRRKPPKDDAEWQEAREAVLLRDSHLCQAWAQGNSLGVRCWGRLHVHHILPRSRGGGHASTNLVTLCAAHHDFIHGHPVDAREHGLLL